MENNSFNEFEMQLTDAGKDFLREVGKWAGLLSIVGYIYLGMIALLAIMMAATGNSALMAKASGMGAEEQQIGGAAMAVLMLLMGAIMFFPIFYLNKFSANLKKAFRENSTEYLTNALEYLKSHYKFIGIFTIIGISLYALMFILMIVAVIAGAAGA